MSTTNTTTQPKTNRTPCPISKSRFIDKATALPMTVTVLPREFSTGSVGWFNNGKVDATVDGVAVKCQMNVTLTVSGSKKNSKEYNASILKDAKPETLELTLNPMTFSTGSFGWSYAGKHYAQSRECQLSFNVTVANSKEAAA